MASRPVTLDKYSSMTPLHAGIRDLMLINKFNSRCQVDTMVKVIYLSVPHFIRECEM